MKNYQLAYKSLLLSILIFLFSASLVMAKTEFKDYKDNKFWSDAMNWSTNEGIIKGIPKKDGHYLLPGRTLTEAEFITILFRYGSPDLINKYSNEGDSWTRVPYLLSKASGVSADKSNSYKPITRGTMAKYLIQALTGENYLSEKEAVLRLYEMGLTNGKPVNGEVPRTYESYFPKETLTRGEGVTFLHRLYYAEIMLSVKESLVLNEILEEEELNGSNIKSYVSAYGVKVGMTKDQVEAFVGKAKFTSKNEYGLDWHVHYNDKWNNFFMVAYLNGKVVQLYSNQDGLVGLKRGMTKSQVLKHLNVTGEVTTLKKGTIRYSFSSKDFNIYELNDRYITVFYDLHQQGVLSSVFVTTKEAENLKNDYYGKPSKALERGYEKQIWALLNARRVMHNVSPLQWSEQAETAAYKHSLDMSTNDFFNHINLRGTSPFDRMENEGIRYRVAGENIAYGQISPIFVVEAWMNSFTGHRENSIKKDYTHIGVGVSIRENDMIPYYTQNFYTPY